MRILSRKARLCGLGVRALITGVMLAVTGLAQAQFEQPGTQPKEHDFQFHDVASCYKCHANTSNGPADPYFSWQGGMMAQAARDPVFRAALAIANQDIKGSGEFCIRCHAPRAWLEGRSTATDASLLKGDDLHGVSCDVAITWRIRFRQRRRNWRNKRHRATATL